MSRHAGKIEVLQNRHDYLVDALAHRGASEGVKGFWRSEAEALAWAIPLLTEARRAIAALIEERLRERQRVENAWRQTAFRALEALRELAPEEREKIVRRMPEDVAEALADLVEARRYGAKVPAAEER